MRQRLLRHLRPMAGEGVTLAFSGGVDSTLLLAALCEIRREKSFPLSVCNMCHELIPREDSFLAADLASRFGVELLTLTLPALEAEELRCNAPSRCYACKSLFFARLRAVSQQRGLRHMVDGTNADDLGTYRPGLRALAEQGVRSPLAECGISKAQVRQLALEYNLPNARRPSTPCLATRFDYGTLLSSELLQRVEEGERALRVFLPHGNLRLRVSAGVDARLEVDAAAMPRVLQQSDEIVSTLHSLGFRHISLDLAGFRSGSFDK